jgi:hypothetical protein
LSAKHFNANTKRDESMPEIFKKLSGLIALLSHMIIWGGCVYAAFTKSGLGAAFLMALLAIPVNLIIAIATIPVLEYVVFKIARASLLDRLLMILLVPAHTFAVSVVPYSIYISPKYQGQELFYTLLGISVSPISLLMASGLFWIVSKIVRNAKLNMKGGYPKIFKF